MESNREYDMGDYTLAEYIDEFVNQTLDDFSSNLDRPLSFIERRQQITDALREVAANHPVYVLKEDEYITQGEGRSFYMDNDLDYDGAEFPYDLQENLIARGWDPQIDHVRHTDKDANPWIWMITRLANPNSEEDGIDPFIYISQDFATPEELCDWLSDQPTV